MEKHYFLQTLFVQCDYSLSKIIVTASDLNKFTQWKDCEVELFQFIMRSPNSVNTHHEWPKSYLLKFVFFAVDN